MRTGISRREALRRSGLCMGGLACGSAAVRGRGDTSSADPSSACYRPSIYSPAGYSYFNALPPINGVDAAGKVTPMPPLDPDELRISFMGSAVPPYGKAQMLMSIFVQVGWVQDEYFLQAQPRQDKYRALDQFVLDCGTGSTTNYNAMNINWKWMDKILLSHLHADRMSDLSTIYAFGGAGDRKSPLFVFGPGPSGVRSPRPRAGSTTMGRTPSAGTSGSHCGGRGRLSASWRPATQATNGPPGRAGASCATRSPSGTIPTTTPLRSSLSNWTGRRWGAWPTTTRTPK